MPTPWVWRRAPLTCSWSVRHAPRKMPAGHPCWGLALLFNCLLRQLRQPLFRNQEFAQPIAGVVPFGCARRVSTYASAAAALAGEGDRDGFEFVVKTRATRGAFWKKSEPEYSSLATLVMDLEGVTVADGEAPVERFGWREVTSCKALQQDKKDGRHRLLKLNLRDGPMMFETEQAADIRECFNAFTQAIADSMRAAAAGEAQPPQQAGRGAASPAAAQLSDLFGDAVGEAEARRALEARNGDIQQAFEDLASRLTG